jgi:uracil-DNA glycosylase
MPYGAGPPTPAGGLPEAGSGNDNDMVAVVPEHANLRELAAAAQNCRGCELYERATQTVFGAGPARARVLLVGEQPGDVEDRRGEPFVGPAGKLLDRAFDEAGLPRNELYVTNAVKHFRWKVTASTKRRIHEKPGAAHITACHPWLDAELAAVRPSVVVALGAVAAQSLFGASFRVTQHRGEVLEWPADNAAADSVKAAVATVHPSAVLRAGANRDEMYAGLVADLRLANDA